MKKFSAAVILACCALVFALAGCSGAKSTSADSLKGFWEIDPASTTGFEAALNLDEDNFAELILSDAYLEGEWSADGNKASIKFDDEHNANIYVSGDKLILGDDNGSKLVFIKSDADKYYEGSEADGVENLTSSEAAALSESSVQVVDEVINDIKPVTVADDKVVKIEVTGKGTDFTADPGYRLSITNKTDKTIDLTANDMFKVGGKDVEAGLGEIVEPGETVEAFMYFAADDLGGGIDKLTGVEGTMVVSDDESSDELGTYSFKMD